MGTTGDDGDVDRVLVGVDGSENSLRAFDLALSIAVARQWSLRLVGAFRVPYEGFGASREDSESYRSAVVDAAQRPLDSLAAKAGEAGVAVSTRTGDVDAASLLVHESRTARLAVVGKRGRSRFASRFLGTVSGSLAAHSRCPTLVVPERASTHESGRLVATTRERSSEADADDRVEAESIELVEESAPPRQPRRRFNDDPRDVGFGDEIVVGIDVDESAVDVALRAAELAEVFAQPLTLVSANVLNPIVFGYSTPVYHSFDTPQVRGAWVSHLEEVARQISAAHPGLDVYWQFFDGSADSVLTTASRTASLVAVGTRGRGGFAGLLLGSVSQKLLNRTTSPVLVVPGRNNHMNHGTSRG